MDGGGGRYGCVAKDVCTQTQMHVQFVNMMPPIDGGHLQFYTCVCVRMHARACAYVGTPPMPPMTPPHPPGVTGSPKQHFNS